jgi:peptidoglycan/xylan/chitin deacetylase (PgdA/CDA1 family)
MIPILLYHQIAEVPAEHDPLGLAVTPERFEQQMVYLYRAGYHCLSLTEAVHRLRHASPLLRKSFVITIDDGYRDIYTTVWPILDRYGFTATVFLVAGRSDCLSDWEGQCGLAAAPLLSWVQVRELASFGITFGGHTLTHPRLTTLDDEQALNEARQAKRLIEDNLRREVRFFSYPYHDYNDRIQGVVTEAGYDAACGGRRGRWGLFNLWRVDCKRNDNQLSFALKAGGKYHQYTWLREQTQCGRVLACTLRQLRSVLREAKP